MENCWRTFPELQDALQSRILGTGTGKPATNLGRHCPAPCPHLLCGVSLRLTVSTFSSLSDSLAWQSPIASVQRTRSTLANHSAVPRGVNVKRMNTNRAIRIAAQRFLCFAGRYERSSLSSLPRTQSGAPSLVFEAVLSETVCGPFSIFFCISEALCAPNILGKNNLTEGLCIKEAMFARQFH